MENKDIKVYWSDTPAEIVERLLEQMDDRNFVSNNITLQFPNGFEVESAFVGKAVDDTDEWYFHGCTADMEGDIRINSLPDSWLSVAAALLKERLGIVLTDKQADIKEMYDTLYELISNNTEYLDWPNDEVSYIDDIDKILEGGAEQGSSAAEYYGNGDFTLKGLYEERAGLQLTVIKDLFNGFIKSVDGNGGED